MVLLIRAVRNTLLYIFYFSFASFLFAVFISRSPMCVWHAVVDSLSDDKGTYKK